MSKIIEFPSENDMNKDFREDKYIYYIASNETAFANGWIYGLISLLLGWWGIWGLFYTPVSIWKAFKGVDVTDMVMGRMQEHYHSSNGVFSIEKNELCGCIFPKISQ